MFEYRVAYAGRRLIGDSYRYTYIDQDTNETYMFKKQLVKPVAIGQIVTLTSDDGKSFRGGSATTDQIDIEIKQGWIGEDIAAEVEKAKLNELGKERKELDYLMKELQQYSSHIKSYAAKAAFADWVVAHLR